MKKIGKIKKKVGLLVGGLAIIASVSTASAYTFTTSYSTTVGNHNGNGYSDYNQKKITRGANGDIYSTTVGGNYQVDVRMQDEQGNSGSWVRNIDDGTEKSLPGHTNHLKDDGMRLHFSSNIYTPVDVQVTGKWRSDN